MNSSMVESKYHLVSVRLSIHFRAQDISEENFSLKTNGENGECMDTEVSLLHFIIAMGISLISLWSTVR